MKKWKMAIMLIILLIVDQVTKLWAKNTLEGKEPIILIKDIFSFQYLEGGNTGAAFGILQGSTWILSVIIIIILFLLVFVLFKIPKDNKYKILEIAIIVLIAGAAGNLIDRVLHQYVIDFIYINLIDFPIFNVADCYVTVSAIILFILVTFYYKDEDLVFLSKSKKVKEK